MILNHPITCLFSNIFFVITTTETKNQNQIAFMNFQLQTVNLDKPIIFIRYDHEHLFSKVTV